MKFRNLIFAAAILLASPAVNAQTLNWAGIENEQKHILTAHTGIEHGIIWGVGYGRKLNAGKFPIVLGAGYSFASGKNLFDDSKLKLGGQINIWQWKAFQVSARLQGIARTTKNDFVRITGFGSDGALTAGVYKPKWFVAGEMGYDKSIVIHLKHGQAYKDNYAQVVDGWYQPDAGGNIYFGLTAGRSFGRSDITVKAGRMLTEQFKPMHALPLYFEIGYNLKF
ncbi:MAG: hypothetical protein MUC87_01635 [Bacteroidia bacterium]|jgi:hypothetical protein|nr:hypothetical protein [Bacteroidia bacterium]